MKNSIRSEAEIVTCEEMKLLEQQADAAGLSYYQMMENAGTAAFAIMRAACPRPAGVTVFCGKGNNGGDGFVVARKFRELGAEITVILVDGPPMTTDAVINFSLIEKSVRILDMTRTDFAFDRIPASQIIVDAIYGTGFHGSLGPNARNAADFINQLRRPSSPGSGPLIYALDIPSGLSGDAALEGEIDPAAVKAHGTITFHKKKPVHLQPFAAKYCGEISIADIGIRD